MVDVLKTLKRQYVDKIQNYEKLMAKDAGKTIDFV